MSFSMSFLVIGGLAIKGVRNAVSVDRSRCVAKLELLFNIVVA